MKVGWKWRKHWEFKLMLKCQHQCHCACNSQFGISIIKDAGRQAAHKKTTNCMDVLYCPPPLASGNTTHPCNSGYLGKIFLYIDHKHMECLYNIVEHSGIASLYFNICQNIMTYFYSHLYNVYCWFHTYVMYLKKSFSCLSLDIDVRWMLLSCYI
jgi:hypothetical protein